MSTSQNGFAAIDSGSDARMKAFPWVTGKVLAGPVFTVLDYLARRFHAEVEPIRRDHSWGYAARNIRGAEATSNHASATAVDFNAPSHPLGRSGTFSPGQRAALLAILRDLDDVVRWGGTYSGRKDEMHFEINASPAKVAAVAQRITGGAVSAPTATITQEDDLTPEQAAQLNRIEVALKVAGAPYYYPEAIKNLLAAVGGDVSAASATATRIENSLKIPGQPFGYPAATHNAVNAVIAELAALRAVLEAHSSSAASGVTPDLAAAAKAGAKQALADLASALKE